MKMPQESKAMCIIEDAINSGAFGDKVKLQQCEFDNSNQGDDHFASVAVFVKLRFRKTKIVPESVDSADFRLVMKMQNKEQYVRDLLGTDVQFYNEVIMYKDILPFLNVNNEIDSIFSKFYYGKATLNSEPEKDCVITEDLREYGYKLTDEKLFLDYDHCVLALRKLAKLHALSYYHKQNNRSEFFEKVDKIQEARWSLEQRDDLNRFLTITIERGFIPLLENEEYIGVLEELANKMEEPYKFVKNHILVPNEPISVICHGDFCRNNMLFKYNENGKPIDVKFFDVATVRYASPVIDISFFLALNMTSDVRLKHWDDLLSAYHDALATTVPGVRVPTLDDIKEEMRAKAVYGYILCSFFVPMMVSERKVEFVKFAYMSQEEIDHMTRTNGGQQATDLIVAILKDLILKKCL